FRSRCGERTLRAKNAVKRRMLHSLSCVTAATLKAITFVSTLRRRRQSEDGCYVERSEHYGSQVISNCTHNCPCHCHPCRQVVRPRDFPRRRRRRQFPPHEE